MYIVSLSNNFEMFLINVFHFTSLKIFEFLKQTIFNLKIEHPYHIL